MGAILARLHDGANAVLNDVANVEYLSTSIRTLHDAVMCDLSLQRTALDLNHKSFHMHAAYTRILIH